MSDQKIELRLQTGAIFRPYVVGFQTEKGGFYIVKRFRSIQKARAFRDANRTTKFIAKVTALSYVMGFLEHNAALILGVAVASILLSVLGLNAH